MSLHLFVSMPAASPDGPSDAEEGERRRGINAPPENGQQKRAMLRRAVGGYRIASWCPPTVSSGLAPRADRIRLQCLHQGVRPLEQGRGCGLWLPAADLGLDRLLAAMNSAQENGVHCLPTHRRCHVTDAQRAPLLLRSTHGAFRPTATRFPQPDAVHRHGRTGGRPGRASCDRPPRPDRAAGRGHSRARESRRRPPAFEPEIPPDGQGHRRGTR